VDISLPLTGGTLYGRPVTDVGVLASRLRTIQHQLEELPADERPTAIQLLEYIAGGMEALEEIHMRGQRGMMHRRIEGATLLARELWDRTPPV